MRSTRQGPRPSRSRSCLNPRAGKRARAPRWPSSSPGSWASQASTQSWSGTSSAPISNDLARDQAPALATRAFQTHNQDGVAAVLHDFVERVGDVRSGGSGESEGGGGFPTWLLAAGGAIAALLGVRAYRRRQRRERELGEVKAVAREDLVALADDVVGLDEQVDGASRREGGLSPRHGGVPARRRCVRPRAISGRPRARLRSHRRLPLRHGDGESAHERSGRRRSGGRRASSTLATAPRSRT